MKKYIKPTTETVLTELSGGYAETANNSPAGEIDTKGTTWNDFDNDDDSW